MSYTPKSAIELYQSLRTGLIGRSSLTDLNPISALSTVLQAVAEEMASAERRLFIMREGFYLRSAIGADLDDHVSQLPPVGITRIQSTNASAACLRVDRSPTDTATSLTIVAGSLVSSISGQTYQTTNTVIMPAGAAYLDGIHIVSTTAGSGGNAGIGQIRGIVSMPSAIISVSNEQPLTNGADRETDNELRNRAINYLKSLSRCSKSMIEFVGTTFVGSSGERFKYARLYEDPNIAGYSELMVDDGSGLTVEAVSKNGRTSTTNIGSGGLAIAYHDAPATQPITPENIIVWRNADPLQQIGVGSHEMKSIPERGIVYFNDGVLQAGDRVFIQNYRVFTGVLAELQRELEGNPTNFDRFTGFRAAGTRVVVQPVRAEFVQFDVSLLVSQTADYAIIETRVILALEEYVNSLLPAQPLYISKLIEVARSVVGVRDIHIYERGTTTYADNIFPSSAKAVLRLRRNGINPSSASN